MNGQSRIEAQHKARIEAQEQERLRQETRDRVNKKAKEDIKDISKTTISNRPKITTETAKTQQPTTTYVDGSTLEPTIVMSHKVATALLTYIFKRPYEEVANLVDMYKKDQQQQQMRQATVTTN